jgi:putative photosynthetic complex assembly protein
MNAARAQGRVDRLPHRTLILAAVTVAFAVTATAAVRIANVPPSASPAAMRAAERVAPVASRELRFLDRADGAVVIRDARTGGIASVISPGQETGFIRGVMRGLARERRQHGVGAAVPFTLTAWRDGELSLTDQATGRSIEMTAFGTANRAAFAALLDTGA